MLKYLEILVIRHGRDPWIKYLEKVLHAVAQTIMVTWGIH